MYAATQHDVNLVADLLRYGADPHAKNDSNETAFSYACSSDAFDVARILYAAGVDVNTVDATGGTPLDWASQWASDEFRAWLVKIGCKKSGE
jgi:ankyrin repeat protein